MDMACTKLSVRITAGKTSPRVRMCSLVRAERSPRCYILHRRRPFLVQRFFSPVLRVQESTGILNPPVLTFQVHNVTVYIVYRHGRCFLLLCFSLHPRPRPFRRN